MGQMQSNPSTPATHYSSSCMSAQRQRRPPQMLKRTGDHLLHTANSAAPAIIFSYVPSRVGTAAPLPANPAAALCGRAWGGRGRSVGMRPLLYMITASRNWTVAR